MEKNIKQPTKHITTTTTSTQPQSQHNNTTSIPKSKADLNPSTMTAPKFPSKNAFLTQGLVPFNLPRTTPAADRECCICGEPLHVAGLPHDPDAEQAVKLPCDHVIGRDCLLIWTDTSDNNTCPLCRKVLYPRAAGTAPPPINGAIRRCLLTGGTLGSRVMRLKGPGIQLERVAQYFAEGHRPEQVLRPGGRFRRAGVFPERTYPRDQRVMREARQDPAMQDREDVLLALSKAADGVDTNSGWDVLCVSRMEENEDIDEDWTADE